MKGNVFIIAGRAGVGKTAFVERLIPHLKSAGLSVTTMKISKSAFQPDYPAKDIHRHLQAGADRSIISQPDGTYVFKQAVSFEDLLENERKNCDVLLLEGVPQGDFPSLRSSVSVAPTFPMSRFGLPSPTAPSVESLK